MLKPHIKLFWKTKRDLELVSLPHCLHEFSRKIFLILYSINWPNFIVWLSFPFEAIFISWFFEDIINFKINISRSSHQKCSINKSVLRNFTKFTGNHLCQSLFFNKVARACNFIKKETLAQVFSCEFCEILKNTFLHNTSGRLLLY